MPLYDYIHDGKIIYQNSFATIRKEADLSNFTEDEARIAVRVIHACGRIEITKNIIFSPDFIEKSEQALFMGSMIFCDSEMVAHGITRRRLPANNKIICTLNHPDTVKIAQDIKNTRSAAAIHLWGDTLKQAVVVIGNAPTALFHLINLLDQKKIPQPAAIIGVPVGFVGAAESKLALQEWGAGRILNSLSLIAYFCKKGEMGHARQIATPFLIHDLTELRFEYPLTTEIPHYAPEYKETLETFYDHCASKIQKKLDEGQDIGLLCEGDPLLYGSAIYILERLQEQYTIETIPGVMAMNGCWSRLHLPIVRNDQTLTILSATLPLDKLLVKLNQCESIVIMKIGRNLAKYIERGTQNQERILPLSQMQDEKAPYFSLILIAGKEN